MNNKIPYDGPVGFSIRDYYTSKAWKEKAKKFKIIAGNECFRCGSHRRLDVHHRTYKNVPREKPEDLIVLCTRCHETIHKTGIIIVELPIDIKGTAENFCNKQEQEERENKPLPDYWDGGGWLDDEDSIQKEFRTRIDANKNDS